MPQNWIDRCELANYGKVGSVTLDNFSNINLVIGENGTGKTFFLKALYSAVRAMEEYKRGDANRSINEILIDKLRWTFQVERPGDIVTKGTDGPAIFQMTIGNQLLGYQFGPDCTKKLTTLGIPTSTKEGNSIFIPAKEVLSLFSIILKSREMDQVFGFDDTYYDLVKALRIAPSRGKNYSVFAKSRKMVDGIVGGKVDYDDSSSKWYYKQGNQKYSIGSTSEGVKKIAIMDRLLANGCLDNHSIIFIDEIESALHPDAICAFLDVVDLIASEMGIQFFISSHSYFVIKKLYLIALKRKGAVKCISLSKDAPPIVSDLSLGMPKNSIIDASIRLYEQEMDEVF